MKLHLFLFFFFNPFHAFICITFLYWLFFFHFVSLVCVCVCVPCISNFSFVPFLPFLTCTLDVSVTYYCWPPDPIICLLSCSGPCRYCFHFTWYIHPLLTQKALSFDQKRTTYDYSGNRVFESWVINSHGIILHYIILYCIISQFAVLHLVN